MATTAQHPTGRRRQEQKTATRALILEAARNLFEAKGFEATTMRAIAAEAGVGLGTIFNHFEDKGALLMTALLEDLAKTDREILDTLPGDATIRDQILHVAAAGFGYWCARPALSAALLREMWFIRGPAAEERQRETAKFIGFVVQLLEGGQQRGELDTELDLQPIAEALYTFYVGSLIRAAGNDRFVVEELLEDTRRFINGLLRGIGARHD